MSKPVTKNACVYCAPLGASLAFKGIENCITLLHGSQGCATYMRRFLISHFREPMDIASSSFTEHTAIFGGGENLKKGLDNVIRQYQPSIIGVASTCLSETIGDDVSLHLQSYYRSRAKNILPKIIDVSTPSYKHGHVEGFFSALKSIVNFYGNEKSSLNGPITLISGMVSCEDLRFLKDVLKKTGVENCLLPDYSTTLEGGAWNEYIHIPPGGTPESELEKVGTARCTIELSGVLQDSMSPATLLEEKCNVPAVKLPIPIGLYNSDLFYKTICEQSGIDMLPEWKEERSRLLDAFGDCHKYVFDKRVVIYGDEDFILGISSLLLEAGMKITVCGSQGKSGRLKSMMKNLCTQFDNDDVSILDDADFSDIETEATQKGADLVIGSSKGYGLSKKLGIPLVRLGFPIHDRVGGQRIFHLGYKGAISLLDTITNAIMHTRQSQNDIGYSYL